MSAPVSPNLKLPTEYELAKMLCETDPSVLACAHRDGKLGSPCAYHSDRARPLHRRLVAAVAALKEETKP